MANYKLDFTLTTDVARTEYISSLCTTTTYTQKQYTQMADYILLANSKQNAPFIYPEEFSNPKREHIHESLDELLDNSYHEDDYPTYELNFSPVQPTIYKKCTRKIDRNNPIIRDNPQFQQLWNEIDHIDSLLSTTTNYKLSKLSIALHKQQYDLLENFLPQWPAQYSTSQHSSVSPYFNWYRGIQLSNGDYADLDLTNYTHMAKFLKLYPDLLYFCTYDVSPLYLHSELYTLLSDVQLAISKASLSPIYTYILHSYWKELPGTTILHNLSILYGKNYNQSTLSTIFNTTIAKKITTEYTEIYLERLFRNTPERWRTCPRCGKTKLLTTYNFHRASGKPKGFSTICKDCVNKKRKEYKQNK